MDISLSLESAIEQAAAIQNEFKQPNLRLSQYCEYGNSLDFMLRDCLVCGINHDCTQQWLLSKLGNLSSQKAMEPWIFHYL